MLTLELTRMLNRLTAIVVTVMLSLPAMASDQRECPLADGSAFLLSGHRWPGALAEVGKHDVFHAGRVADAFAYAYTLQYRPLHGETVTFTAFNDDEPDCRHYGQQDGVIYAYTDRATFRFMTPSGKRGGSVLVVSTDGGRSFSENRHPNSADGEWHDSRLVAVFQQFGYYRSRFAISGDQYRLEITNPLDYQYFLLFTSVDGGKHWLGPQRNESPQVYAMAEVQKWRDQFAGDVWINKSYRAGNEACRLNPGQGCARDTSDYWAEQWRNCRRVHSGRECLALLPEPVPRPAMPVLAPAAP